MGSTVKSTKQKIFDGLFALFVFTIPFSQRLSSGALILLVGATPFLLPIKFPRDGFRSTWDLLLFYGILVTGLIYSTDQIQGMHVLERDLSMVGSAFVLGFFVRTIDLQRNFFYPFAAGIWVAGLLCLFNAANGYFNGGGLQLFFFEQFTTAIDAQPAYLAYYIILAITCGLYLLYYEHAVSIPFFLATMGFLFFLLLLTGAQTTFISLQLILGFFLLKYLLGEQGGERRLVLAIAVFMMSLIFLYTLIMRSYPEWNLIGAQNDYWERWTLWESGIHANPDMLFGIGTGDYSTVLNEYYRSHNMANYAERSANAHNQYIQTFFMNGLVGLTALLILLVRPLYLYGRRGWPFGILVLFPFVVYGITEVFLGRYQGVVLFGLLHQMVMVKYYSDEQSLQVGGS